MDKQKVKNSEELADICWEAEHENCDLIGSSPDYVLAFMTKNCLFNGSPNIFFRPQFLTSCTALFTGISFIDWIVFYPSRRVIQLLQHRSWARALQTRRK